MHESNRLVCVGVTTTHICETGEAVVRGAFQEEIAGWEVKPEQALEQERPVL